MKSVISLYIYLFIFLSVYVECGVLKDFLGSVTHEVHKVNKNIISVIPIHSTKQNKSTEAKEHHTNILDSIGTGTQKVFGSVGNLFGIKKKDKINEPKEIKPSEDIKDEISTTTETAPYDLNNSSNILIDKTEETSSSLQTSTSQTASKIEIVESIDYTKLNTSSTEQYEQDNGVKNKTIDTVKYNDEENLEKHTEIALTTPKIIEPAIENISSTFTNDPNTIKMQDNYNNTSTTTEKQKYDIIDDSIVFPGDTNKPALHKSSGTKKPKLQSLPEAYSGIIVFQEAKILKRDVRTVNIDTAKKRLSTKSDVINVEGNKRISSVFNGDVCPSDQGRWFGGGCRTKIKC